MLATRLHRLAFFKKTEKSSKVSRSLLIQWHRRFSDGWESVADDKLPGRPAVVGANVEMVRQIVMEDRRKTYLKLLREPTLDIAGIRRNLVRAFLKKRPGTDKESMIIQQDNAPPLRAHETLMTIDFIGLERIIHSPYSPDIAQWTLLSFTA
ncbi:hypothetical protein MAR_015670 [Mya arenaria]|uniref:Transposase n=1 Tax=Mya arenaria TaxID=6604 RepID=A0ABY7FLT7_MYAAR|nr:hypothetical protein MAR_015670 [Mya arenaria]